MKEQLEKTTDENEKKELAELIKKAENIDPKCLTTLICNRRISRKK